MSVLKYTLLFLSFWLVTTKATATIEIDAAAMMADTVYFDIDSVSGQNGETVCVDFRVFNYVDIGTGQLRVQFNPYIITPCFPVDVSNSCLNGNISAGNFNEGQAAQGEIPIVWFGDAVTCPDGAILFTICFKIIGEPGDCSYVTLDPVFTEINNDATSEVVPVVIREPGSVKVLPNGFECVEGHCNPSPGMNDGSLYTLPVGGVGPYSYTITPGPFSGSGIAEFEEVQLDNLPAAMYTITFTDSQGMSCTTEVNLFESSDYPMSLTLDSIPPTCFDRFNGEVSINSVTGGVPVGFDGDGNPAYEVVWSNGTAANTVIDRLPADCYSVTVTDFFGCRQVDSVNIKVDTLFVDVEVITPPSCGQANDGTVILTASGGIPNPGGLYDFCINGIDTFYNPPTVTGVTSATFNDIPNGTFEAIAKDYAGISCQSDPVIIVFDEGPNFTVDIEFETDPCLGGPSVVLITPSVPATYAPTLTDSDGQPIPTGVLGGTIRTIDAIPPGIYDVTLENISLGCILDTTFTISEADPLVMTTTPVEPDCDVPDGSITVSASGGTAPYTFDWNIDTDQGDMREDLGAGEYKITLTDANGCQDSVTVVFIDSDSIPLNVFIIQAISCAELGQVGASVTGNDDFTFEWSDGNNTISTDAEAVDLTSGTYYVTATSGDGCTADGSIFLANPITDIEISFAQTGPSCAGANDGALSPTPLGGVPPYTFVWKEVGTNDTILEGQVLVGTVGEYMLCVTDAQGCPYDTIVEMVPPANAIDLVVTDIVGAACFDECSGAATFTATGGTTPGSAFGYNLNGSIVANSASPVMQTAICPGENFVFAFDVNCPSDTVFFTIPNQDSVGVDLTNSTILSPACLGESTGSIEVQLIGVDTADATLTWLGQGVDGPLLDGLPAGDYDIEISYGAGCTVVNTITLTDPEELFVEIDPFLTRGINCNNDTSGAVVLRVFGGAIGDYSYNWSPNVSITESATNLGPGTYNITVTDAGGCSETISYDLASAPAVTADIPDALEPDCFGEQTCLEVTNAGGGTGNNFTFTINNGPRIAVDTCVDLFAGSYLISVFDSVGCSFDTTITILQPEELTVEVGPDQVINVGESSEPISAQAVSVLPIDSFGWSPAATLDFQTPDNQVAIAMPVSTTVYTVTVTDENGCTATDDVTVAVEFQRNVYRPNAFAPDTDGANANFQLVTGSGVEEVLYLYIYDRWGTRVYAEENYMPNDITNPGWDGTYNGSQLNAGVYIYVAEARFVDGAVITYSGDVALIR